MLILKESGVIQCGMNISIYTCKAFTIKSFILCILHQILGWSDQGRWDGWSLENGLKISVRKCERKKHLGGLGIDGRIISK
jgi:hypothetical protein